MTTQTVYVQVTLHREDDCPDAAFVVPMPLELPDADDFPEEFNIDVVLESVCERAKDLLRPYLNNQTYFQVDTPALPHLMNPSFVVEPVDA